MVFELMCVIFDFFIPGIVIIYLTVMSLYVMKWFPQMSRFNNQLLFLRKNGLFATFFQTPTGFDLNLDHEKTENSIKVAVI